MYVRMIEEQNIITGLINSNRQYEIIKQNIYNTLEYIILYYPSIILDLYFGHSNKFYCDSNGEIIPIHDYLLVSGYLILAWTYYNIYLIWRYDSPIEIYEINYSFIFYISYHLFYIIWISIGMFILSNMINKECDVELTNYLFIKIISCYIYYLLKFIGEIFR